MTDEEADRVRQYLRGFSREDQEFIVACHARYDRRMADGWEQIRKEIENGPT